MVMGVVMAPFLIKILDVVAVVPTEVVEVAGLPIFSAKFVLIMDTLLMYVLSKLISVFSHMSP